MSNKISVITVVYNDVKHIRETMESFFSQTWEEKEYIVIDGGSTDGTADVVADVTYVNGEETERTVISSVTLTEPVTEQRAQGTKARPSWYPTGSFRWPTSGRITSYFGYRNTGIRGAEIADPANYPEMDAMVEQMVELRKGKMTPEQCRDALKKVRLLASAAWNWMS